MAPDDCTATASSTLRLYFSECASTPTAYIESGASRWQQIQSPLTFLTRYLLLKTIRENWLWLRLIRIHKQWPTSASRGAPHGRRWRPARSPFANGGRNDRKIWFETFRPLVLQRESPTQLGMSPPLEKPRAVRWREAGQTGKAVVAGPCKTI